MFIKEQDFLDISAGWMLQQVPALKLTGKYSWHKVGTSWYSWGLRQCPHRPSDYSSREIEQKDNPSVCPDFSLVKLRRNELYKFSLLQHWEL